MNSVARGPERSPCFRTDAAGDILLRPDWAGLLPFLRDWGDWFLQTRHCYARLAARTRLADWTTDPRDPSTRRDPAGELHLQLDRCEAVARLEFCPCCGSPGMIEVRNRPGRPVCELRAPPDRTLLELAAVPARFAAPGLPREGSAEAAARFPSLPFGALPRVSAAHLPGLLRHCGALALPLLWRLLTPESDHRRIFVPQAVAVAGGVLAAADRHHHACQLVLPAARALVCECTAHAALLHVVAADDTLLLTLAAGDIPEASPAWEDALAALSPAFRQP